MNVLPPYTTELSAGSRQQLSRVLSANAWGVMQIEVHSRNKILANLLNSECNAWRANKALESCITLFHSAVTVVRVVSAVPTSKEYYSFSALILGKKVGPSSVRDKSLLPTQVQQ